MSMAAVDALKEILDSLSGEGVTIAGVISRNGIPIVCNLPSPSQVDTFSTLSATILGAGEVIFSGLAMEKPDAIILSSPDGNMVCTPLSPKALLVLFGKKQPQELVDIAAQTKKRIKEVLS